MYIYNDLQKYLEVALGNGLEEVRSGTDYQLVDLEVMTL